MIFTAQKSVKTNLDNEVRTLGLGGFLHAYFSRAFIWNCYLEEISIGGTRTQGCNRNPMFSAFPP